MRGKIVLGPALCGVAFVSFLSLTQKADAGQKPPQNETAAARLIDSIQGPALYRAYCAVCHGSEGKANGPMASALKVRPSDLTRISARNGGTFPSARIEKIISGEEPLPAGHGTREMPVWGPVFSQVDRDQDLGRVRIDNLARYIKEIQAK